MSTTLINNAITYAGIPIHDSTIGNPLFTTWMVDASDGLQSFDVLCYGDSNNQYSPTGDTFTGFIDGLAKGFELLGIPCYGSPIYWAGCPSRKYGLYFNVISTLPGGTGTVELGSVDSDAEYATPKLDLTGPAGGFFSTSLGTDADDWVKVESASLAVSHKIYADITWPLGNQEVTGRWIYIRTINNAGAYNLLSIHSTPNQGNIARDLSGQLGYAVATQTLNAATRSAAIDMAFAGAGVGNNSTGKAGFVFNSMHTSTIGCCVSSIYSRAGASSTNYKNDLSLLYNHNSNTKLKLYIKEVVDRQLSANSKNTGRVAIFFNCGHNATAGATATDQANTFVADHKETARLLKETWISLGYKESDLCFIFTFAHPFSTTQAGQSEYFKKTREKLYEECSGIGLNALVVNHTSNLPAEAYVTQVLWDAAGNNTPSSTPASHLVPAGYLAIGKVITSSLVNYFKGFIKQKK
jgi:hypothetical protein